MKSDGYILHWSILLLIVLAFSACQKVNTPVPDNNKQEVTFSSHAAYKGKKNTISQNDLQHVDYALIGIDTKVYAAQVYNLEGTLYTTSIKLAPGTYTLTKFLLMNNNQTPTDSSDDVLAYATPMAASDYASFVDRPAGFSFNVGTLVKTEVPVEVLLFNPDDYQKFGFSFAVLPQTTIREQHFTGRFLPADPNNYLGSLYQSQTNGLKSNMPAIYRIDVYRNNTFVVAYNNENTLGEQPLTVQYPDGNQTTDTFRFDLFVYVKSGTGFDYRFVHSWEFSDGQTLHHSSDGVVHFVVGDAQNREADYAFGPVANLPQNCTLFLDHGFAPGSLGGYFDVSVSTVSGDYSLVNGNYPGWCGTDTVSINLGHPYAMAVIGSLTPELLPAYARTTGRWNQLNWLFNHLDNYSFYDWDILQGAAWMILNDWNGIGHSGVSDANSLVLQMVADARHHSDFIPGYGQKAAVIFIPEHTAQNEQTPKVQLVFTLIDL